MTKKYSILVFLLLSNLVAVAQITTSKIKGTVTDDKGKVLFGTTVVVLHEPTGTKSGTITQENGKYTVPNLRVGGPYKITFSYLGYASQEINDIYLTLGKTTNIDGKLVEEGTELEEVVITTSKSSTFNKY